MPNLQNNLNYQEMKSGIVLILLISIFAGATLDGQNSKKKITISGLVSDAAQNPVPNAIIMIDGLKTGSTTDQSGYYKVKVKSSAEKIGIFATGGGLIEESINGRTTINFTLTVSLHPQSESHQNQAGDEEINVGYGSVKKKNMTQTVNKIDAKSNKFASYTNIFDMIKGQVPGVSVSGNHINIQGSFSIYGSTEPLFVVDGVPRESIDDISPASVKSIEVLKGAAAGIYGTRGANGVILITLTGAKDTK
jgi:TonB-dependent starch-binding outer membrane protein SusC